MAMNRFHISEQKYLSCTYWTHSAPRDFIQTQPAYLVDDVDAIINLLSSEDRVEVVEPVLQVIFSVPEWNDDGNLNNKGSFYIITCLFSAMVHRQHLLIIAQTNQPNK